MIKHNKIKKEPKDWITLGIWIFICILFIYDLFFNTIKAGYIWILASILLFISLIIQLIRIRSKKKKK